jgi:hypothetical protein
MTNAAPTETTGGTSSAYESNGLSVAIDWNPNQPGTLWATVTTKDYRRLDELSAVETAYIIRTAANAAIATGEPDHKHYARIYWGMIL